MTPLALPPSLRGRVTVGAVIDLLLTIEQAMDHSVVATTEDDETVQIWILGSAIRDRINMVCMKRSRAISEDARECAFSVTIERALAQFLPGGRSVYRHRASRIER